MRAIINIKMTLEICIETKIDIKEDFLDVEDIIKGGTIKYISRIPEHIKSLSIENFNFPELPSLPKNLEKLYCSNNLLMGLPPLPAYLTVLDCSHNLIADLPTLPTSLEFLDCRFNNLVRLPTLPPNLSELDCISNQLVQLPVFPASLRTVHVSYNDFLYVPKEIAQRFEIHETPNYWAIMQRIKLIKKSRERKRKLQFCTDLQDCIDELRYRPGGSGYWELKEKNKNVFL